MINDESIMSKDNHINDHLREINLKQDDLNSKEILRFAPSPTGLPHIGNLRTALVNWMYINSKKNATLRLRIEDTDSERSKSEFTDAIIDALKWLNVQFTGDIVVQSQRRARYVEVATFLLDQGLAYRCDCAVDSVEVCRCKDKNIKQRDTAVKLSLPRLGELVLHDRIKGDVVQKNENLQDIVILRRDMSPTYMFCVVVDDHDMNVSLVIRGEDHLTNTFKQIHIYNALKWSYPEFAHLPMLLAPDGTKLSKRNAVTSLFSYIEEGILPEALKNYLIMLSWHYERVQKAHSMDITDVFDIEDMVKYFDLSDVKSCPSKFDWKKLLDMNFRHISSISDEKLLFRLEEFIKHPIENSELAIKFLPEIKKRANTLKVLYEMIIPYIDINKFKENLVLLDEMTKDIINHNIAILNQYFNELAVISDWTFEYINKFTREFAEKNQIKMSNLAQVLRLCICGMKVSIGIFESMVYLGKAEILRRIGLAMILVQPV